MKNLLKIVMGTLVVIGSLVSCSSQDIKPEVESPASETNSVLVEDIISEDILSEEETQQPKPLFVSQNYFCTVAANSERYMLYFRMYSAFSVRIAEEYTDNTTKIVHDGLDGKHDCNFEYGNFTAPNLAGWDIELYAYDTPEYIWCFHVDKPATAVC